MSKLEIYAIVVLVLILAGVAAYLKGRGDGRTEQRNESAAAVLAANNKVDALQAKLDAAVQASNTIQDQMRTQHAAELASVRSDILSQRLCRLPANPAKVPAGNGAGTVPAPPVSSGPLSIPTPGTDEWRRGFIQACQADSDAVTGWNAWCDAVHCDRLQ